MTYLSQRDKKWRDVLIGQSNETIGMKGCVVTNLSMLSSYFFGLNKLEKYLSPKYLAKALTFTPEANIIWSSVDDVCPFVFNWRYYKRIDDIILGALENKFAACMVRVNYSNFSSKLKHWVIPIAVSSLGKAGGYVVADPINGKKSSAGGILSTYRTIDGIATFQAK